MIGKLRLSRYALSWLLGPLAACGPRPLPNPTTPSPEPTSQPAPLTTQPAPLTSQPAPLPTTAASVPHLQLTLSPMAEHTGGEFGLTVPMLLLALRNVGEAPAAVPPPGLDMLLSLQVVLKTATTTEHRRVTLSKPWPITVQPLAPQTTINQSLSPLSREQRDAPLPPGHYQVSVCVIPDNEALYHSTFTEQHSNTCSNTIDLVVRRGK